MSKLHMLLPVTRDVKSKVNEDLSKLYHLALKPEPYKGLRRIYEPLDDQDQDIQPDEEKLVELDADRVLTEQARILSELFDVVYTTDDANSQARADLVVDGTVLVKAAPVSYLLWLEQQVLNMRTFVAGIPTLDPGREWHRSEEAGSYTAKPVVKNRNRKVRRNHVIAAATQHHKEQVEVYTEDVPVGKWTETHLSGALSADRRKELVERINRLYVATKMAREQANTLDVSPTTGIGDRVFGYLFA